MSLWKDIKRTAGDVVDDVKEIGGNLFDDIGDTATGFLPGIVHIGKSVAHDAGEAVDRVAGTHLTKDSSFSLDDIGKSIAESYKYTYGPAFDGDFEEFGKRLKAHPLGPILDVLTVLTMGGGGVAKAGKLAAEIGHGSRGARIGAKLAGFERIEHPTALTAAQSAFKFTDRAGGTYIPRARTITGGTKGAQIGRVASNPVKRMRGSVLDKVSETFPEAPVVGAHSRIAKSTLRDGRTQLLRDKVYATRTNKAVLKKWKPQEQAAFVVLSGGHDLDQLIQFYQKRLATAAPEHHTRIKERINVLSDDKTRKLVDDPNAKIREAVDAGGRLSTLTTTKLKKHGVDPRETRPFLEQELVAKELGLDFDPAKARPAFSRPHTYAKGGKSPRAGYRSQAPKNPDQVNFNSGFNFANALDAMNPAQVMRTYHDALAWDHSKRRFQQLKDLAVRRDALDDDRGYVSLDKAEVKKWIGQIREFLDDADVQSDSPLLAQLREDFKSKFDVDGELVVPKSIYDELVGEFQRADNFATRMIDKPTAFWRAFTLNLRPAWIVNNFAGQFMLLLASHGLYGTVRGMLKTMPGTELKRLIEGKGGAAFESGFGRTEAHALRGAARGNSRTDKLLRSIAAPAEGMGKINAILTDDGPRRAAFYETLRPHAKALRKELSKHGEDISTREAMIRLLDDDTVMDEVTQKVLGDLVDFRDLSQFEREVVRRFVPFYSWLKGMNKRTANLVGDDPHTALMGSIIGQEGGKQVEQGFGFDPASFMRGSILLGDPKDGRQNLLTTGGLNPFTTPADTAGMLQAIFGDSGATGGQNPLSQFNPFIKGGLAAAMNKDPFSGFPVDPTTPWGGGEGEHGLGWRFARQVALSTPYTQSASNLGLLGDGDMLGPPPSKHPLYNRTPLGELMKLMGVPIRDTDLSIARKRAEEEHAGPVKVY